ncbi:hypothetical protein E3Q24_04268 [Wallemia mellicola]|nr:hypothetical protein E3Q24_04268 [Wallemia mellicola]
MSDLINKREDINNELNIIFSYFKDNNIKKSTPLLDKEGFPRNDLDIVTITQYRQRLTVLQNDLERINQDIYKFLEQQPKTAASSDRKPIKHSTPWSIVKSIKPSSIADNAGLLKDDLIIQFGPFSHLTLDNFEKLPGFIQENRGNDVRVIILRDNQEITYTFNLNGSPLGLLSFPHTLMSEMFNQLPTHDGTGTFIGGDFDNITFTPSSISSSLPSNISAEILELFTDEDLVNRQPLLVSQRVKRGRRSSKPNLCSNCIDFYSDLDNSIYAQSAGLNKRPILDCNHVELPTFKYLHILPSSSNFDMQSTQSNNGVPLFTSFTSIPEEIFRV